jgi:hypothetical protein
MLVRGLSDSLYCPYIWVPDTQKISNSLNSTCRDLTIDILSGRTSHDYTCGLMWGNTIPTRETLSNLFGYFKVIRPCHPKQCGTLTETDRFNWWRVKQEDIRGGPDFIFTVDLGSVSDMGKDKRSGHDEEWKHNHWDQDRHPHTPDLHTQVVGHANDTVWDHL